MSIRNRLTPRVHARCLSESLEGRVLLAGTTLVKDLNTAPTAGLG